MEKKISIIVPVYNTEKYVRKCLDSICKQSHKNLEIFVVECGSSDDSLKICREFEGQDGRISLLAYQDDLGIAWARKEGIDRATGDYYLFVDSDDYLDSDACEKMVQLAERTSADIVMCAFYRQTLEGKKIKNRICQMPAGMYRSDGMERFIDALIGEEVFSVNGAPWSKLFSSFVMDYVKKTYNENIKQFGDDWEIVFPAIVNARGIYVSDDAFYHAVGRIGSASVRKYDDWYLYVSETLKLLKKSFSESRYAGLLEGKLERIYLAVILTGIQMFTDVTLPLSYIQGIDYGKKTVLYGAGWMGKLYYDQFRFTGREDCIIGWTDLYKSGTTVKGRIIESVDVAMKKDFEQVIIANMSEETTGEIMEYLSGMGVDKEKLVWKKPCSIIRLLKSVYASD